MNVLVHCVSLEAQIMNWLQLNLNATADIRKMWDRVSGNLRTTQKVRRTITFSQRINFVIGGFSASFWPAGKTKELTAALSSFDPLKQIFRLKIKAMSDPPAAGWCFSKNRSFRCWHVALIYQSTFPAGWRWNGEIVFQSFCNTSSRIATVWGALISEQLRCGFLSRGRFPCLNQGEDFPVWILMLQDLHHCPSTEAEG